VSGLKLGTWLILQPLRLEGKRHLEVLVLVLVLGLLVRKAIEDEDENEDGGSPLLLVFVLFPFLVRSQAGRSRRLKVAWTVTPSRFDGLQASIGWVQPIQ
jgi:hypothetical protein